MASNPPVLVSARLPSAVLGRLEEACDVEVRPGMSHDELREHISGKHGLVCLLTDKVDRGVIDAAPDLRIVANIAVGYDNIDVRYAAQKGITVTNTPNVLTESVAEFTWGLILAVTRRIVEGDRLTRDGRWAGWALDFMLGASLSGKQLGIVGYGQIGRAVAARAPAFGMRTVYASRSGSIPAGGESTTAAAATAMSLDQLLLTSDVVSLHLPFSAETTHLIDMRALARMKRSAYLINTARGPIVDEAALVWALQERLIAGAALDVYEREPLVHPELKNFENVVLAPHLGSATRETRTAMANLAAQNVVAVLTGGTPLTPVRP